MLLSFSLLTCLNPLYFKQVILKGVVVIGRVSQSKAYGHVDDGMSVLLGRVDGTMRCSDICDVLCRITCLQHVLRLWTTRTTSTRPKANMIAILQYRSMGMKGQTVVPSCENFDSALSRITPSDVEMCTSRWAFCASSQFNIVCVR